MQLLHTFLENISTTFIAILRNQPLSYFATIIFFICVMFLIYVFSKARFLSFKILIAWVISSALGVFLVMKYNEGYEALVYKQALIAITTSIAMRIFYIVERLAKAKKARKKVYGKHQWWVNIISFLVIFAFCFLSNVILYAISVVFYL